MLSIDFGCCWWWLSKFVPFLNKWEVCPFLEVRKGLLKVTGKAVGMKLR